MIFRERKQATGTFQKTSRTKKWAKNMWKDTMFSFLLIKFTFEMWCSEFLFFELLHTFFRILIKKMVYTMQFYLTIDFHHKCKFSTCIYCGILYLIFWIICSRVWDYMCKSWVNHLCFLWADLFGIWNLKKRFFTMFGQSHKDRSSERN